MAKSARRSNRVARDFILGLAVFGGAAALVSGQALNPFCGSAVAQIYDAAPASTQAKLTAAGTGGFDWSAITQSASTHGSAIAMLLTMALAFAAIFALNLWFSRHIRLAYRRQSSTRRQPGA